MSSAQASSSQYVSGGGGNSSGKLKSVDALPSMIEGSKFLKWNESGGSSFDKNNNAIGVTLRTDDKCFILFWRDANKKTEYLDLLSVRDVKTGRYASLPRDKYLRDVLSSGKSSAPIQDKTITICYGPDLVNIQVINFVCVADNAEEIAREWTDHLFKCISNPRMQNLSPWENLIKLRSCLLHGKAVLDEKSRDYKLPVQTLVDTFVVSSKQNTESERQHVIHMLQSVGIPCGKNEMLDQASLPMDKFFLFFLRLVSTEDIDQIFTIYMEKDATKRKLYLAPDQFENFLNREQRDPGLNELLYPFYNTDKAAEMILKFETDENFKSKKQLSPQGLMRYLMDFENEVIDPVRYELYDDMEQPLSHYFVNSSHNTYLTGHQITGKSDVDMYRQVLLSGARCIELDCHEDDNLDEPIITHGRTLCTKILFSDVIQAINECAFKTSPYPVILSFENFCGKKMQEKMAKYMIDIFGDQLLKEPLAEFPLTPGATLPSPENLKYKILVKFRSDSDGEKDESYLYSSRGDRKQSVSTPVSIYAQQKPPIESKISAGMNSLLESPISTSYQKESQSITMNSDNTLSNMVNYFQPTRFKSFDVSQRKNKSFEISSFVETTAFNLHKEKPIEFVNYNKRQFSRIYPKGTRISSENYMPQIFWNVGCQMVALNFQTLDLGMQLNMGKFEYNSRSGYLLKPDIMRQSNVNKSFDPFAESPLDGIVASTLKIRVISGVFLNSNEKRLGYSVMIELYGLPADSYRGQKAYRVKASSTSTFNVVYSDPNGFTLKKIIMPQLALLKITAFDEQNKLIGHRVLPVVGLRPGYRYICLKNESNQQIIMSTLFVHIKIHDYVPEEFEEFANALMNPISYVSSLAKKEELLTKLADETEDGDILYQDFCTLDQGNTEFPMDSSKLSPTNNNQPSGSNSSSSNGGGGKRYSLANPTLKISTSINSIVSRLDGSSSSSNTPCSSLIKPGVSETSVNSSGGREKRFSFSVEKFGQSLMPPKTSLAHIYDRNEAAGSGCTINKSQTDLSLLRANNSLTLSSSLYNVSRSCSVNYDLDLADLRKLQAISNPNGSLFNDPKLFDEINLEELKLDKTYASLSKEFSKKLERLDRDGYKRAYDIKQTFMYQASKLKQSPEKAKKNSVISTSIKQSKRFLVTASLKLSKSSNNLEAALNSSPQQQVILDNNNNPTKVDDQLEAVKSSDEFSLLLDKFSKALKLVYEDMYRAMKQLKFSSIETLCNKLEELIEEKRKFRIHQLKLIAEKEKQSVNKEVHSVIKLRKKKASQTAQDKNEFNRLSREIEKESVAMAVSENTKIEELWKAKQKLVQNVIDKSIKEVKSYKDKLLKEYDLEYTKRLEDRIDDISRFLSDTSSSPVAADTMNTSSGSSLTNSPPSLLSSAHKTEENSLLSSPANSPRLDNVEITSL